jgi:hypothetical protein
MDLPIQIFNGKEYRLYPGERYYSRGTKRLHVEVWKYHNGAIPKGYSVHHLNQNTQDNCISNLTLLKSSVHQSFHIKERHKKDPEWSKRFHDAGIEAAKSWHKSEVGKTWHSKQATISFKDRKPIEKSCMQCGSIFLDITRRDESKFCSNKCKSAFRRSIKIDNEIRTCVICGIEFSVNKYAHKKTCGRKCASKSRKDR